MTRLAVISNPKSRRNLKDAALAGQLRELLGGQGVLEEPTDRDALAEMCRRFREENLEVLAVNGGDGTLHTVLTAMVRAYGDHPLPKVTLLCGGTMNTVAHGLRATGRPARLLSSLVRRLAAGETLPTTQRHLLCVNGEQYGFMWGTGVFSNFLELYYEGDDPSPLAAAIVLSRGVCSVFINGPTIQRLMKPYIGEAWLGDEHLPKRPWVALAAGTVDQVGLGFAPFYRSLQEPGKIHAVALSCSPLEVVAELPRVWLAKGLANPQNHDAVCEKLVLETQGRIGYMLDGDLYEAVDRLELSVGPQVQFVLP